MKTCLRRSPEWHVRNGRRPRFTIAALVCDECILDRERSRRARLGGRHPELDAPGRLGWRDLRYVKSAAALRTLRRLDRAA